MNASPLLLLPKKNLVHHTHKNLRATQPKFTFNDTPSSFANSGLSLDYFCYNFRTIRQTRAVEKLQHSGLLCSFRAFHKPFKTHKRNLILLLKTIPNSNCGQIRASNQHRLKHDCCKNWKGIKTLLLRPSAKFPQSIIVSFCT